MSGTYQTVKNIFYICLIFSFVILLVPGEYKIAVYTPNILGWFWLTVLIPLTFITFILLLISDFKKNRKKTLLIRSLIFITVLVASVGYWFNLYHNQ